MYTIVSLSTIIINWVSDTFLKTPFDARTDVLCSGNARLQCNGDISPGQRRHTSFRKHRTNIKITTRREKNTTNKRYVTGSRRYTRENRHLLYFKLHSLAAKMSQTFPNISATLRISYSTSCISKKTSSLVQGFTGSACSSHRPRRASPHIERNVYTVNCVHIFIQIWLAPPKTSLDSLLSEDPGSRTKTQTVQRHFANFQESHFTICN